MLVCVINGHVWSSLERGLQSRLAIVGSSAILGIVL